MNQFTTRPVYSSNFFAGHRREFPSCSAGAEKWPAQNDLTKAGGWCFISTVEMKNTFATMKTHTPVNGWMAICQRYSRPLGVVGVKF
jgi:hypothetical protein